MKHSSKIVEDYGMKPYAVILTIKTTMYPQSLFDYVFIYWPTVRVTV